MTAWRESALLYLLPVSLKRVSPPRPNKFLFFLPLFKRGYLEVKVWSPNVFSSKPHCDGAQLRDLPLPPLAKNNSPQ